MKDIHGVIAACILALLAIIGVFIGYATDTLPQQKQRMITIAPDLTETTEPKKKDCRCCTERTTAFEKEMDEYIKRKKAEAREIASQGSE